LMAKKWWICPAGWSWMMCVCAFECSTKSLVLHIQRPCLVSTSTGQNMY
jgi:hypothetical protein